MQQESSLYSDLQQMQNLIGHKYVVETKAHGLEIYLACSSAETL